MKWIISLILVLVIGFLAYALYLNIREPIAFQKVKNDREDVVVDKLKEIRKAQEIFRDITGAFAGSFDSLNYVLKNDSIKFENIIGDPDDPTNSNFIRTVTYTAAYDSIKAMGMNLDSLRYVPYAKKGTEFLINADTMTYQSTLVTVCEVGTRWKEFMGEYGSMRYAKYDNSYDPNKMLKFGDMNAPNLTGNWER
ncbi:MAG: hypothetical protein HKN67_05770 [Saprospiraceae bacterium]|nr:hypothetical protein [Bacteroidia bacterium]MBT8228927.1 hypothetical protein [Bacteroidia bacterium]NNF21428.1 hypothetical protein [Saprospiraceae bacterium]